MSTALELVYKYRQLAGKCETCGLTMDEIDVMTTIEALFKHRGHRSAARRFTREDLELRARLRGRGHTDPVRIEDLTPAGLTCRNAPYFERGDIIELVVNDPECALSYRFKAEVTWTREDVARDDFTLGAQFVGQPVLLRYGRAESVDDLANAATGLDCSASRAWSRPEREC